jgi:predicted S18 family serine protease
MIAQIKKILVLALGIVVLSVPLAMIHQTTITPTVAAVQVCGNSPEDLCNKPPQKEIKVCGAPGDDCYKFIQTYINPFITLLTVLVGVFAAISIVVAGIQYSSSADDPSAVSKAKTRIFNTVIGLVAYVFFFAFLEWLLPGGLIG